ncbi:carbohydrate ABC transporter permease [uncultured Clostridium sp.]|uniref:carbohydrate ABC transporter permease n=1 Tax=uncultured Clostridium sp. TaxID=59620 RepID=UPI00260D0D3C|nr:sugar ABC transporter permease [uncultured Clostridium sp.]
MIALFSYSFTSWNGISTTKEFIGFDNYIKILTDEKYIEVFKNCIYYFASGIFQMLLGFTLACILSFKTKFKGIFKSIIILPILISGVAISLMFRVFFAPNGTLDFIFTLFGMEEHIRYWIGDPRIVNFSLAFISLWRFTAMSFILYFTAIQSIPRDYFKAAMIEGSGSFDIVRYVIIPSIGKVIKLNSTMLIIGAISVFDIPMIMTDGSNGTSTFLVETMKTAFESKRIGLAASMAIIVSIVIIIATVIQRKMQKEE